MDRKMGDLTTLWRDDEAVTLGEANEGDEAPDCVPTMEGVAASDDVEASAARSPAAERRRARRQFAQGQRRAREAALQVLFEVDLVGHDVADVRERQFDQMLLTDAARVFADRLLTGVLARRESLDGQIAALAPTWPVAQLPRVDVNVLRLALYEMTEEPHTPIGAVINEAVELAKQYGSENSGKFINGVLGTFAARRDPRPATDAATDGAAE